MVEIVAEIGSNHCGSLALASTLIETAKTSGATIAKFQAFDRSIWTSQEAWEKRAPFATTSNFLSQVASFCASVGIEFMCTPFYPEAISWLDPLVKRWKVASADAGNTALLGALIATGKPLWVSCGFTNPWSVPGLPLLCVSQYPARPADYALGRRPLGIPWGLSDHTPGLGVSVAAVALGAQVIEKHLRLKDQPPSPDDGPWALEPAQFATMVSAIRDAEAAVGSTEWGPGRLPEGRRLSCGST